MKKTKFLCAIFAAVICALCFAGCSSTKNAKVFPKPSIKEDSAVEMTIYAFDAKSESVFALINLGHAFLTFKNVSDSNLTVGGFVLPPNEEVSVGTWGQNAHWGIWYNVESTYMSINRYDGRLSLTHGLTADSLKTVNDYLALNDTWTPFKNCSYFAVDLWNLVSEKDSALDLGGLITPSKVAKRISKTDGNITNRTVSNFGKVGYAINSQPDSFTNFTLAV